MGLNIPSFVRKVKYYRMFYIIYAIKNPTVLRGEDPQPIWNRWAPEAIHEPSDTHYSLSH
jgi:hypothetical protein